MIPERLLFLAQRVRDVRHASTDPTRNPHGGAFEVDCQQLLRLVQSTLVRKVGFPSFPFQASALRELTKIAKTVPDAAILLHDTFLQSAKSGYNSGPDLAIVEIMERFLHKWRHIDSDLGLPKMFLLHPMRP